MTIFQPPWHVKNVHVSFFHLLKKFMKPDHFPKVHLAFFAYEISNSSHEPHVFCHVQKFLSASSFNRIYRPTTQTNTTDFCSIKWYFDLK